MPKDKIKAKVQGKRGVIYARYSSHLQRDASIEQQIDKCKTYANSIGLQIAEVYTDRAVSGRTDKRPGFQRMMHDAEHGKFDFVVAWKSNRMGRNMLQAMVNEARLQDSGVSCLYVEEDFDDTAAGRFALRNMMNVNQFYSENMAEDIMRGLMDNARRGLIAGAIPYGFKRGEDGRFAIDEPRAEIVQEIFTRVSCGDNYVDIANDLNARGLKTKTGARWNKNSFRAMLANERYRGVYIYCDYRKEGDMPRIISDDLFYKVQEAVRMKKAAQGRHGTTNADYLLTGKLFCGHCKSYMTGMSGTSKSGNPHYYYTCQGHVKHTCDKKNVRKEYIERVVAQAIMTNCLTDEAIEYIADQTEAYFKQKQKDSGVSILEDELANVNASIKNLIKAIEAGIITETTRARLLELEGEQSRLDAQIRAEKSNLLEIDRDKLTQGMRNFRSGSIKDEKFLRSLFDTFLIAVYLYDDHLKLLFSFAGDKNSLELPIDIDSLTGADGASTEKSSADGAGDKFRQCSCGLPETPFSQRPHGMICRGALRICGTPKGYGPKRRGEVKKRRMP